MTSDRGREPAEDRRLRRRGAHGDRAGFKPPRRDASEFDASAVGAARPDPAVRNLQLGVGKSVIVDLPEEAGEIYVGDPKIANAIVRSAKRIYISGVANGQTSIFALAETAEKSRRSKSRSAATLAELSVPAQRRHPGK